MDNGKADKMVVSPKGKVTGTAVVKDKDGNIKGEIVFEGEATKEQVEVIFGADVFKN